MFSYSLFCFKLYYSKKRDKGPLNYSHIEIIRKNRFIFLGIFVYDISFDVLYNSFKLSLHILLLLIFLLIEFVILI